MIVLALDADSAAPGPSLRPLGSGSAPASTSQAAVLSANPIAADFAPPAFTQDTVCWSGWWVDSDEDGEPGDGRDEDGAFEPNPRTWAAPGWEAFEQVAADLDDSAGRAGANVVFRPHARHVLADPQSTLAWLRRVEPANTRILLDPLAWLTPMMLGDAADHLGRCFHAFAGHPAVWGTVLTGLRTAGSGELVPAPLHQSEVPLSMVVGALGHYPLESRPIVLVGEALEAQHEALLAALGTRAR